MCKYHISPTVNNTTRYESKLNSFSVSFTSGARVRNTWGCACGRRRAGLHASLSGAEASRTALWRHRRDRLQPHAHRVDLGRTRRRGHDDAMGGMAGMGGMGGMGGGAAMHRPEALDGGGGQRARQGGAGSHE